MSSVTGAAAAHEDRTVEARRQRFGQLPADLLARFALLPEWTVRLAVQAGLGGRGALVALVDRLTEAGVLERRSVLTDAGRDHAFWVRPRDRPDLALYLSGRVDVEAVLRDLAGALRGIDRDSGTTDLGLWFDVVDRHRRDDSGVTLVNDVDRLVDEDDLPQAVRLVAAARTVADLCPGPLVDAVRRAQWRLDRAHRTVQDNRFLQHYVRRPGIEAAVEALLDGDGRQWALHLRGDGGVGKTMVVRYLAAGRFATDRGRTPFPVARVDFDDLDPRFPAERPADLLLALVGELLGYGSSRDLTARYRRFIDGATRLHQELAGAEPDPAQVARQRADVAAQFGRLVEALPGPVLLILDTCEELSKLYAPGASAPAIDETFALLRLVHEAVPGIRVLFSGRRPLIRPDDEKVRAAGPRLAAHDFVGELPVGGYTTAEADAFLDRMAIPAAARDAVLRLAADGHGTINPFELTGYAEWVRAEPDVDLDTLAADTSDPYVRRRIIGRLHGPARDALPVAAAFGRFDRALIGPALQRLGVDVDAAFQALVVNEWVQIQTLGPSGEPHVIAVDEHLRDRLHAATADTLGSDLERLGRDAVDVVAATPLAGVPVETIEAALRLLPVPEAAAWWAGIEQRVADERAWAWAAQVTPRAAATARATAVARGGADMTAAVLATQAAAQLHTGSTAGVSRIWLAVGQSAAAHPDPVTARRLSHRASLAFVEGLPEFHPALPDVPIDALLTSTEDSLAAGVPVPVGVRAALAAAPPAPGTPLEAGRLLALAGAALLAGHTRQALEYAERAWQAVTAITRYPEYVDWVRPRRLDLRCHQALLICAMRANEATVAMGTEAIGAGERAGDDHDGAVLASLGVDCLLRFGLRPLSIAPPRYLPRTTSPCWTHAYARPLVVSYTDRRLLDAGGRWLGRPTGAGAAASLLQEHLEAANRSGVDTATIDECTVALIRLCRRYRTREHLPSLASIAASTASTVHDEAAMALALMHGTGTPRLAGRAAGWLAPLLRIPDPGAPVANRPAEHDPDAVPHALADALLTGVGAEGCARPRGAGLEHVLDLWQRIDLRAGLHPALEALPRGLCGAALLNAGELLALSDPDRGAALLRLAAERLSDLDPVGAAQADTLAALADRRAGRMPEPLPWLTRRRVSVLSSGWRDRASAARGGAVTLWAPELAVDGLRYRREWSQIPVMVTGTVVTFSIGMLAGGVGGVLWILAGLGVSAAIASALLTMRWRRARPFTVVVDDTTDPGDALAGLARDARSAGFATLKLALEPAYAEGAWEAGLLAGLGPDDALSTAVYRSVPARHPRPSWLRWLTATTDRWTITVNDRIVSIVVGRKDQFAAVMFTGTPVDTYAGARFRIQDVPASYFPPAAAAAIGTDNTGGEGLLNVGRLIGGHTILLVLAAEPVDGPPRPLADQRAGFIELAQSAVEAGAAAVLVVPPLPDEAARGLERLLTERIIDRQGRWRRPPRPKDVLRLSTDVKRLVAEPQAVGDVILYLRDR
ncbi:hypothetical protein Daura_16315 [Dactylosporangium aurantiacum]|uniref:Uncharacterized protein n=1 Tax=Dactylosporangium aurantiacum TaxID=35754 RepID=A0A9Q9IRB3_9ACTN|nr:hypothetical protein [Dactylosporangium aurantiacum]MDG6103071.1 hypothetical protein [Dactylosporangium aurantiacum]UWZ57583.1 hypothetical protein Daura_16315 [Dactylosporangium aurantiacum]